jgi:hypothetical protein
MHSPLAELLSGATANRCAPDVLRSALTALGPKAAESPQAMDAERRAALVSLFVRNLRGLPVAEAALLEHELLSVVGAMPSPRKSVGIRDALSLVALRNYIRYLTVAINLGWAPGMQIQSAISELARLVQEAGGGRIDFQTSLRDRSISLHVICSNSTRVEGMFGPWVASLPSGMRAQFNGHDGGLDVSILGDAPNH